MGNSWGSQGPARGSFLSLAGLGTFRVLPPGLEGTIPAQVEAKGASPGGFGIRESRRPLPTTLGLHRGGSIPGFSQQQERQGWEWAERRERPGVRLSLRPSVLLGPQPLPPPRGGSRGPTGGGAGPEAGGEAGPRGRRRTPGNGGAPDPVPLPGAASHSKSELPQRQHREVGERTHLRHPRGPRFPPVPPGSPRFPVPVPAPPCPPRTRSEP